MSLINVNQINIVDATPGPIAASDGSIIISRQANNNLWSSNYDGAVLLPRGTPTARDAAIPVPLDGYIQYNTISLEFEGFTNTDWRPIGQLTRDGTAAVPSRSFINDIDTGSFLADSDTYAIAADGIQQITVSSPINLRITSSDDGTGTIHWSDTSDDRAFIRYNHDTDKFEFSGDGTNVAISIDGDTNDIAIDSDVTFNGTVNFGASGALSSPDDFIIIIDSDDFDEPHMPHNVDTTSVFKIQRHDGQIDTGFQVTQDGTVQAAIGSVIAPSFTFEGHTNSGWYFDELGIDKLVASFNGLDTIQIVAEHTTFKTRIRVLDGDNLLPSITFADHSTTGIYHVAAPLTFNIAVDTVEKLSISGTEMTVFNDLMVEGSVFLGTSGIAGDDIELLPTATETLSDGVSATFTTYDGTVYEAVMIDYFVKRTDGSAIGTLYIVTDGIVIDLTDVTLTDANRTEVETPGVTFTVTVPVAGTVDVKYTLSNTGNDATIRYGLRRWGI